MSNPITPQEDSPDSSTSLTTEQSPVNGDTTTPSDSPKPSSEEFLDKVNRLRLTYERNADRAEKWFLGLRILILILTTLASLLAVANTTWLDPLRDSTNPYLKQIPEIARYCLIVVPISTSVLLAGSSKLDKGTNWMLLKGAAETLNGEMYYCQTQTEKYEKSKLKENSAKLIEEVKKIHNSFNGTPVRKTCFQPFEMEVKETNVNKNFLKPKNTSKPRSLTIPLDPKDYISERVEPQFQYYRSKAKSLSFQLEFLRWIVYALGGLSTFLATNPNSQVWVAVSGTLVGAISSYLELKRMETTLINYNQAADILYQNLLLWNSLDSQDKPSAFDKLVQDTEKAIQGVNSRFLQEMQTALKGDSTEVADSAAGSQTA